VEFWTSPASRQSQHFENSSVIPDFAGAAYEVGDSFPGGD